MQDIKKTLIQTQKIVTDFAGKINAPTYLLPTFSSPIGDATPNIEVDPSGLYHFVISERGTEIKRNSSSDINDLLYWIFSALTFSMACDHELKNRVKDKDCRRLIFAKQEELLGFLSSDWKERERKAHESILRNHPFDDQSVLRATYADELRAKGLPASEIGTLVNEKYPESE